MRDPKTHAKVLALREEAVREAEVAARRKDSIERWERLTILLGRVRGGNAGHRYRTGWSYDQWTTPPCWRHITIIPDREAPDA